MVNTGLSKILAFSAIFTICQCYNLNSIIKCAMTDSACAAEFYKGVIKELAENGIPEMGISVGDPHEVKNVNVLILGLLNLTLTDGFAKGFKTCHVDKHSITLETKKVGITFLCEKFNIEGDYRLERTPALVALLGDLEIHGNGNAKIESEKIQIDLDYGIFIKRLEDGEIHFLIDSENLSHTFNINGKTTVTGNNLVIGGEEISGTMSKILSQNQDFTTKTFGSTIINKIVDIFTSEISKFFVKVPANKITMDDLTSYVS